ncbi:MAG: tripartite tricarboxylate transporter TctB family protein [Treponema sp.]|jgi:hypothetical protein|nr:tripartite tricarboxylate transporter TctB family protein [Treponema sp.]
MKKKYDQEGPKEIFEPSGGEYTADKKYRERQFNFWGSLGLLVFALAYVIASLKIGTISTAKWYESPSLFPVIIGVCLVIFCGAYMIQNIGGRIINADDRRRITGYLKSPIFFRLTVSIGLLAIYIFVLLGLRIGSFKLPYEAATFMYLFTSMLIFRTKKYALWKICLISLLVSVIVGLSFGKGAKIPLP